MEMTRSEKRTYLWSYMRAYHKAEKIGADIARLRMRYAYPSAIRYSDTPGSHGSGTDLSGYMAKVDELERELRTQMDRCIDIELRIRTEIDTIMDERPDEAEREREILRLRYIDGLSWRQIARSIPCDIRTATRAEARALDKFAPLGPIES